MSLLALLATAGCAHYVPSPLASVPPLAPATAVLPDTAPGARLSVDDITRLALERNPTLVAVRAQRGLAQAQLLQSGILPNPTLAGAFLPLISGVGSVPAWNVALGVDITALITYRARRRAANASAGQVYADILWQEWQLAGQARQLSSDLILGERTRPVLVEALDLLTRRNEVLQQALSQGNATLVTVAPTALARQAARSTLYTFDQRQLALRHQLNALLGLVPEAMVPLSPEITLPPFDPAAIRASLATLPDRRPDLLALRLGYAAQDANLRVAILSQFPNLILGGSVSSDNSRVINAGPTISTGLPIFDRNQGNIAIATATRARLNAEYAARLAITTGEVGALLAEMEQLQAQLVVVQHDLPAARLAAQRASAAFSGSALDERSYVDLVINRFAKEQEILNLQTALLDRQVALQTLVGAGLPSVDTLPPVPAPQRTAR